MNEVNAIISDIQKGQIVPIYFLMGDESYFIDILSDYIANNILSEDEKGFNQMVLYGRDTSIPDIINNAKRYPVMASYQVIIVKEAQDLGARIEDLVSYVENLQPTTILVICYKQKTIDKRKKLYKTLLEKNCILFESKVLRDYQISNWIQGYVSSHNYTITPKASQMLSEFIGNDLSRISNELEKLFVVIPKGEAITPEAIEENIGFSKDFNIFELQRAIGERNELKMARIIKYFSDNPKSNPISGVLIFLYMYFQKVLLCHGLSDSSDSGLASALKISPYFVNEYQTASKNYSMKKVSKIISDIRTISAKSRGVDNGTVSHSELYKELLLALMK